MVNATTYKYDPTGSTYVYSNATGKFTKQRTIQAARRALNFQRTCQGRHGKGGGMSFALHTARRAYNGTVMHLRAVSLL
jgi:hypothetical protein